MIVHIAILEHLTTTYHYSWTCNYFKCEASLRGASALCYRSPTPSPPESRMFMTRSTIGASRSGQPLYVSVMGILSWRTTHYQPWYRLFSQSIFVTDLSHGIDRPSGWDRCVCILSRCRNEKRASEISRCCTPSAYRIRPPYLFIWSYYLFVLTSLQLSLLSLRPPYHLYHPIMCNIWT